MSNFKELKQLPVDQLEVMIEDLGKEIYQLKNQLAMNRKLEKPHMLKDKKKDKARAILALSEKMKKEGVK
jgi:large subunit ribosomal protein L29